MTIEQIIYTCDILRQGVLTAGFNDKLVYRLHDEVYVFTPKDLLNLTLNVEPFKKDD